MAGEILEAANQLKMAFKDAAKELRQTAGREKDPLMDLYRRMTPDDFVAIIEEFGLQEAIDFARRMEQRRLGVE